MVDEPKQPAFPPPALDTLSAHSSGRITRANALRKLGMDDYVELPLLLNEVRLPHPRVPEETRKQMVARMVNLLRHTV